MRLSVSEYVSSELWHNKMEKALLSITKVSKVSEKAILFHSASGKDSIALLHLMSPCFKEILCVYMCLVKDLEHINRYINYAIAKYPNARFIQVPHYALGSYIRTGYMGCKQNEKQKLFTMSDLTEAVRNQYGIEWAFFGFKQSDSMNRRIMLRGKDYDLQSINWNTKKCYPLSTYHNKDVLEYIKRNDLVLPESYGKGQSNGTNITDVEYLVYLRENYPNDLEKVFRQFPLVERILFEHDYGKENIENQ